MKRWITIAAVALLSACTIIAPTRPPLLSPFGDGTQWVVWEDIEFRVELNDESVATIRVPRGFVTDLTSTPRLAWSIYPPSGKYLSASILHDYLYWLQICERDEADKIFYQTMRDAGVDQATQTRFYVALKHAGHRAWEQNNAEREMGLIRVIPGAVLDPRRSDFEPNTSWAELRESLRAKGVKEPVDPVAGDIPGVCAALGGEIQVKTGFRYVVFGR